jgi:hypothetical protein
VSRNDCSCSSFQRLSVRIANAAELRPTEFIADESTNNRMLMAQKPFRNFRIVATYMRRKKMPSPIRSRWYRIIESRTVSIPVSSRDRVHFWDQTYLPRSRYRARQYCQARLCTLVLLNRSLCSSGSAHLAQPSAC